MTKEEVSTVINDHTAYLNEQARSYKSLLNSAQEKKFPWWSKLNLTLDSWPVPARPWPIQQLEVILRSLKALLGGELLSEEALAERGQVVGDPTGEVLGDQVGDGGAPRPPQVRRSKVRGAPRDLREWLVLVSLVDSRGRSPRCHVCLS